VPRTLAVCDKRRESADDAHEDSRSRSLSARITSYRDDDLPLNLHPRAIRASAGFEPWGAGGATCDRRSWSGLRRRSRVVGRLAA
jgi:hypothetical protein